MTRMPLLSLTMLLACSGGDSDTQLSSDLSARILSPEEGYRALNTDTVTFEGEVGPVENGGSDLLVTWRTDGSILCAASAPSPDGGTVCEGQLAEGEYEVTLQVRDGSGGLASDSISLFVDAAAANEVAIRHPTAEGSPYNNAEPLTLEGLVIAPRADQDSLVGQFVSSRDGDLTDPLSPSSEGVVSGSATLSPGRHQITLEASDATALRGDARVTIDVLDFVTPLSCRFIQPTSGGSSDLDEEVTFIGEVEGDLTDRPTVTGTITSSVDGELFSGEVDASGRVSFSTSSLSVATHLVELRMVDVRDEPCTQEILWSVGDVPEITIDAPMEGSVFRQGDGVRFAAGVSDPIDRAEDLEISWASDVLGTFLTNSPDSTGHFEALFGALTLGPHTITARVTNTSGLFAEQSRTILINTPPTTPELSLLPPSPDTRDDLEVRVDVPATDVNGHDISYVYRWFIDETRLDDETTEQLSSDYTVKGQLVEVEVAAFDGYDEGAPVRESVEIGNAPPSVASAQVVTVEDGVLPTLDQPLRCDYVGLDDPDPIDLSSLSVSYRWEVDALDAGSTDSVLSAGEATKGQEAVCFVTPFDGEDEGEEVQATGLIVRNTPPVVGSVTWGPDPAFTDSSLVAEAHDIFDLDGDPVTLVYEWFVDGELEQSGASPSFDGSNFLKEQSVFVQVIPFDDEEEGEAVLGEARVIQNSPPILLEASVGPLPLATQTEAQCTPGTATDADEDPVTFHYGWLVDGDEIDVESSTLGSSHFVKGQTVACVVTPDDGFDLGDPVASSAATIVNTAPTVGSVTWGPDPAYTDSLLTAVAHDVDDVDGDEVTLVFDWYVGGELVVGVDGPSLSEEHFVKNQDVYVVVTPTDEDALEGEPVVSATRVIRNTPPVLDGAAVGPDPLRTRDLATCHPGEATDLDEDEVTFAFEWFVDGSEAGTGATLAHTNFSKGQSVACRVTPSDDQEDGEPVTSDALLVANTAPSVDAVTWGPDPAFTDDPLTAEGIGVFDADDDSVTETFAWFVDGVEVEGVTGPELGVEHFGRNQDVYVTLTVSDADVGNTVVSETRTIQNTAPTVGSVTWGPDPAYTDSLLTAVAHDVDDIDGDEVELIYEWYVGGEPVSGVDGSTLSGGHFQKGQTVYVVVTPVDEAGLAGEPVSSATRTIQNSPPSVDAVNWGPDPAFTLNTLTAAPSGFSDPDHDAVSFDYEWVVADALVSGVDGHQLPSDRFVKNQDVYVIATPVDEEGLAGDPAVSPTRSIRNTPPVLLGAAIDPAVIRTGDSANCVGGEVQDDDLDPTTLSYSWLVNSLPAGSGSVLPSTAFDKDDRIECVVTPRDDEEDGVPVTTAPVFIANTPPTVGSVTWEPEEARTEDILIAEAHDVDDVDGDPVTLSFEWFVSGEPVEGVEGPELDRDYFKKGDDVYVVVTASDSETGGSATSESREILNTPPVAVVPSVGPLPLRTAVSATCTPGTPIDPDHDDVTHTYRWFVNDVEVGTGNTLASTHYVKGDRVTCEVTPYDGEDYGDPVDSEEIIIANTPPVVGSVTWGPNPAYTNTSLTATAHDVFDADGDSVSLVYRWLRNDLTVQIGPSNQLHHSNFSKNHRIRVRVEPSDSEPGTSATSEERVIQNTPPELLSASVGPAPLYTNTNAQCNTGTVVDPDGDSITFRYRWRVGANDIPINSSTLHSSHFSRPDVVQCFVTPNDGTVDGPERASSTRTVANSPPTAPGIALLPRVTNSTQIYHQEAPRCLIVAPSTDPDGDTISYSYSWRLNSDPMSWSGQFSARGLPGDVYECTVTATDGQGGSATSVATATIAGYSLFGRHPEYFPNGARSLGWTSSTGTAPSWTVSSDESYGPGWAALVDSGWYYSTWWDFRARYPGQRVRSWVKHTSDSGLFYLGVGANASGAYSLRLNYSLQRIEITNNSGWGFSVMSSTEVDLDRDTWYIAEVSILSGTLIGRLRTQTGSLIATVSASIPSLPSTGGIMVRSVGETWMSHIEVLEQQKSYHADYYTEGQIATSQCNSLNTYATSTLASIPTNAINGVRLSGTFDGTGLYCTNGAAARSIKNSFVSNFDSSIECDGHIWRTCGNSAGRRIVIDATCGGCPNPGHKLAPCATNANWGGMNTLTCNFPPSQWMRLWFY
ncbi:MAG: hypothetical protein EA397_17770 [Deltaproteobacteria bacterium]|nr:MAG: hypothetical protein EA397_17770 [Deltaproteobacteria bacterium]